MKRLFIIVIAAVVLYFLALSAFSLEKTADRTNSEYPLSEEIKEDIKQSVERLLDLTPIDISLTKKSSWLKFSEKNDIKNGKANCVGYAQLFTSICNYALEVGRYEGRVKPVVGKIKWCGIDLCKVLKTIVPKKYESFVKDHDFVELDYGDEYVYIDPTLFDFCGRTGWTRCPKNETGF
jgi:hypothetical protein